jgi:hypothetical protein
VTCGDDRRCPFSRSEADGFRHKIEGGGVGDDGGDPPQHALTVHNLCFVEREEGSNGLSEHAALIEDSGPLSGVLDIGRPIIQEQGDGILPQDLLQRMMSQQPRGEGGSRLCRRSSSPEISDPSLPEISGG